MSTVEVAVSAVSFAKSPVLRSEIAQYFPNVRFNDTGTILQGNMLQDFLQGASAAIVGTERITTEVLQGLPNLKVLAKYGVGTDNIDFSACRQAGVEVLFRAGVNKTAVAEHTLGFMLTLTHNIMLSAMAMKQGSWLKNGGTVLYNKVVGIIGLGNVGSEVARLLQPFGCTIVANDIADKSSEAEQLGVTLVAKDELCSNADILTLHVPLTPETRYFINEQRLQQMKPSAMLINTSRGEVVQTNALKYALQNGIIAAAALDVYEQEPLQDDELYSLQNCICTAHIAGNAAEAVQAMGKSAITLLQTWAESQKGKDKSIV